MKTITYRGHVIEQHPRRKTLRTIRPVQPGQGGVFATVRLLKEAKAVIDEGLADADAPRT